MSQHLQSWSLNCIVWKYYCLVISIIFRILNEFIYFRLLYISAGTTAELSEQSQWIIRHIVDFDGEAIFLRHLIKWLSFEELEQMERI